MKITLPTITNGQDLSTLNSNFQSLATELNTKVAYRVNPVGEDNTYAQDQDFNGFRIYNLSDVLINGVSVLNLTNTASAAVATATAAATAASLSQTAAASSASAANASAIAAASVVSAAGSLIAVNNLSDLTNVTTAKTNLGLQNVTNTSDANKPVSTAQQNALNLKADLNSPNFVTPNTGSSPPANDASGAIPNTLWVNAYFAKLSGATFSGAVNGPSPARGDATAQFATSFYVQDALTSGSQSASFTSISSNGIIQATNTVAGASIIRMTGNGSSTQNKFIGVLNGSFVIYNSAGTSQILGIGDSGLLTMAKGINGIDGTVAPQAGQIGEVILGTGTGPFTMTTGVSASVGTIALTPGLWMITGVGTFSGSTNNMSVLYAGFSTTLNSLGGLGDYTNFQIGAAVQLMTFGPPAKVIRVSANTNCYFTGNCNIASGSVTLTTSLQATRIA